MKKKIKILFNNFDRLEKLLLARLIESELFEIIAIVSSSTPKDIMKFIEYDSNHGKLFTNEISFKNIKNDKKITIQHGKTVNNIQIWKTGEVTKKTVEKNEIDFIIDLSRNFQKENIQKLQKFKTKGIFVLPNRQTINQKDFQIVAYGINEKKINFSDKTQVFLMPPIESLLCYLTNQRLSKYVSNLRLCYQVIAGPAKNMHLLDTLRPNETTAYARSMINNIVPNYSPLVTYGLERLLRETDKKLDVTGSKIHVPVTTGAMLTMIFQNNKIVNIKDIIKTFRESTDDLIGYTESGIVAQDVVSVAEYGVIDEKQISFLSSKNLSLIKLGIWYDFEHSLTMSIFKLLLFLSGLK